MSLETEIKKAKTNKDNMKKAKADTDSALTELGGEASTSLNDVPNKIRSLGTTFLDQSKEYTNTKATETLNGSKSYIDTKIGDLASLQTTVKDSVVNSINEVKGSIVETSNSIGQVNNSINEINTNKANKSTKYKVVLSKDSWTGAEAPYNYEISISGMDENKNWEVTNSVDPIMTVEELDAFSNARIIAGAQSTGKINLIAYGEKPTIDINILVVVRGD